MGYYAAISKMVSLEKNKQFREVHLDYLKKLGAEGKVFAKGRFTDSTGGLVIYKADTLEEAKGMAEGDPFIIEGARTYEIHEWEMNLIEGK